jgi:hypothetical protein
VDVELRLRPYPSVPRLETSGTVGDANADRESGRAGELQNVSLGAILAHIGGWFWHIKLRQRQFVKYLFSRHRETGLRCWSWVT